MSWYGQIRGRVGFAVPQPVPARVDNPPSVNPGVLANLVLRSWEPPPPLPPMPKRVAPTVAPPINNPPFGRNIVAAQLGLVDAAWRVSLDVPPAQGRRFLPQRFQIMTTQANLSTVSATPTQLLSVPVFVVNGKAPITWSVPSGPSWVSILSVSGDTLSATWGGTPGSGDAGQIENVKIRAVDANGTVDQWP